jgi:hypothetical protein
MSVALPPELSTKLESLLCGGGLPECVDRCMAAKGLRRVSQTGLAWKIHKRELPAGRCSGDAIPGLKCARRAREVEE